PYATLFRSEGGDVVAGVAGAGLGLEVDDDPGDGVLAGALGGLDDRLVHLVGVRGDLAEGVGDLLEGAADVGAEVELQRDGGEALLAGGAHALEVGDVLEPLLLLAGDLVDDLLGLRPGQLVVTVMIG